ncbi:hypothetical protein U2060_14945, partial [Listeria monocytogenes]|uniref:hypothetical protein n=1 Tax=Listeria monocytogenes TaxID=1639 RepID=UPI002FDBBD35
LEVVEEDYYSCNHKIEVLSKDGNPIAAFELLADLVEVRVIRGRVYVIESTYLKKQDALGVRIGEIEADESTVKLQKVLFCDELSEVNLK